MVFRHQIASNSTAERTVASNYLERLSLGAPLACIWELPSKRRIERYFFFLDDKNSHFTVTWHLISELIKADQLSNLSSSSKKLQQTHSCSDIHLLTFWTKDHLLTLTFAIISYNYACYRRYNKGKYFLLVLSLWTYVTMQKDRAP